MNYSDCKTQREKLNKWMQTCPIKDVIELENTNDYVDYSFSVKQEEHEAI